MQTITQPRTAIDFLTKEKKTIEIEVSDHLDIADMYRYNKSSHGSDHISIAEHTEDWNDFYFELKLEIDFDFISVHERQTHDYPGDERIDFENIQTEIEIEVCQRWNEELEELEDYRMPQDEKKAVLKYLAENIILSE